MRFRPGEMDFTRERHLAAGDTARPTWRIGSPHEKERGTTAAIHGTAKPVLTNAHSVTGVCVADPRHRAPVGCEMCLPVAGGSSFDFCRPLLLKARRKIVLRFLVFSVSLCFAALACGDHLVSSTATWCTNCRSAKARPSRLMQAASLMLWSGGGHQLWLPPRQR